MSFMCRRMPSRLLATALAAALVVSWQAGPMAQAVQINGAGATFPYPIYSIWFSEYTKDETGRADQLPVNRVGRWHPADLRANRLFRRHRHADDRRGVPGSVWPRPASAHGARRRRADLQPAGGQERTPVRRSGTCRHLPGQDRNWNDPAIVKLNAGVALPSTEITAVYRSDSSGTSYILGDFLSKVSRDWRRLVGANSSRESASRPWRQGQRRHVGAGQANARLHRLRRAGLCPAQRPRHGTRPERGRRVRAAVDRGRNGGGPGGCPDHAARLPRVDHQRTWPRGLSDLLVHMDPALPEPPRSSREAGSWSSS